MPDQKPTTPEQARADNLIQAWLEGTLSDEGADEFLSLVTQYPALAKFTVGQLRIDQMLRDLTEESPSRFAGPDDSILLTQNSKGRTSGKRGRLSGAAWMGIAFALLCIVGWGLSSLELLQHPLQEEETFVAHRSGQSKKEEDGNRSLTSVLSPEPTTEAVAVISRSLSARWNDQQELPGKGDLLSPGRVFLGQGVLSIDFFSGARLALEAPCDIEILSRERIVCRSGKLTAFIPNVAGEFHIETPHGTILDHGTGFGISVQSHQTDVHVFEGEVALPEIGFTRLRQGDAVELANGKIRKSFVADESQFVTFRKLEILHARAASTQYENWQFFAEHLNEDPDLLVRFDFDGLKMGVDSILTNRALHPHGTQGVIVGCQTAAGRWPNQNGLGFQSLSDRIRIDLPEKFPSITLTTWVCVHALPEKYAGLLMSDGMQAGNIHWQLTKQGTILLCYGNEPLSAVERTESETEPLLNPELLGKWIHLSVVLDSTTQRATQYFNGTQVWNGPLKMNHQVRIGQANLGNWNNADVSSYPIRNLCGVLGEFTIHRRALSAEEIEEMFRVGMPHSGNSPDPEIPLLPGSSDRIVTNHHLDSRYSLNQ